MRPSRLLTGPAPGWGTGRTSSRWCRRARCPGSSIITWVAFFSRPEEPGPRGRRVPRGRAARTREPPGVLPYRASRPEAHRGELADPGTRQLEDIPRRRRPCQPLPRHRAIPTVTWHNPLSRRAEGGGPGPVPVEDESGQVRAWHATCLAVLHVLRAPIPRVTPSCSIV